MSEADAAFASFVAKLEQAYPEFRVLRPFLARRGNAELAFEAISHELTQAVFHLPELSIAQSKLQWWGEELARWRLGEARHPLTRCLPPQDPAASDGAAIAALLSAASQAHDAVPASDFDQQLARLQPAFAAIESLRAGLLGRAYAVPASARLTALSHLLRQLARLPLAENQEIPALPMKLLARHQLARVTLAQPGAAREAAVREQLASIATALAGLGAAELDQMDWISHVRWRCEQWRARPVAGTGDPFPALWNRLNHTPWSLSWHAWRQLRRGG